MGSLLSCRDGSDTDKSEMIDSPATSGRDQNTDRAVHVRKKPRKIKIWPNLPPRFGENDRFELRKQIASGGYAFVYSGYDHKNQAAIAVKVPNTERAKAIDALKKEKKFLTKLYKGGSTVPEIIWFGPCGDRPVMVMQLLGHCLGEVRKACGRHFSLGTILKMAVELIELCKNIHDCGILHRDCKLKNYLLGPENDGSIYLIDFGLSGRWRTRSGEHIAFQDHLPPYGTMRYAPVAVHQGLEQGRKDDLEALGYMLIYLARGDLPWQSLWHEDKKIIWEDVGTMKMEMSLEELCANIAPCFQHFMNALREMEFEQEPDYEGLQNFFREEMQNNNIDEDTLRYDWESLDMVTLI